MSGIGIYDVNDTVTLHFEVTDKQGNLTNPSGGTQAWYMRPGDAHRVAITFTSISPGIYEADLLLDTPGDWWWRCETLGDIVQAGERAFHVRDEMVVP